MPVKPVAHRGECAWSKVFGQGTEPVCMLKSVWDADFNVVWCHHLRDLRCETYVTVMPEHGPPF